MKNFWNVKWFLIKIIIQDVGKITEPLKYLKKNAFWE